MILPLFSYMNPGAGSLLLQVILMGTAGVVVAGKSLWHSFRSLFTRKKQARGQGRGGSR